MLPPLLLAMVLVSTPDMTGAVGLNFLVIGDWGGSPSRPYSTPIEVATAKQMSRTAYTVDAKFIIALGDNFYEDGVESVEDERFFETFEQVYSASSLHVPWYLVAGNHDHRGNVSAQIAYSEKSSTWNFPDFYYWKRWAVPGTNHTLKMLLVDTVLLCGNSGTDYDLEQPKGPEDLESAEKQWYWIEKELQNSRDHFLIVGGHFPVWSIAEHGPTDCLVDRLKPLLEKYHASAYLCGHDHNLQHIFEEDTGVHYFLSGAADKMNTETSHMDDVPSGSLKFHWADTSKLGGFAAVNINSHFMNVTFIDAQGEQLYSAAVKPRNLRLLP